MPDYKERFEKWQRETKEKFEEIDKQIGLKEKLGESARAVAETAQKSAEKIKSEAEKSEIGKQAVKAAGETIKTATEAGKKAWDASEPIRDAAAEAGKKAGEVLGDVRDSAGKNADRVSRVFNFGAGWTRSFDAALKSVRKASGWIAEKPLEAATTGVSMAVGAGVGVVLTGISSHWLFNSAIPAWSVKKVSQQFNEYLKTREELIEKGELSEAEAERVRFERDIAKKIGAPMLGAYSFATGAVLLTNVINPKVITGAPLDWIIGGNPALESVWFFANGIVCLKTSYEFFMIALDGQEDVQKMVREIKGLLPQAT